MTHPRKVAKLKLKVYGQAVGKLEYQVVSVKNSTEYFPAQYLRKEDVDLLVENKFWDVELI